MSADEVAAQPKIITLTCPTCGAKLKLGSDTNLVYCTSCGNEHLVQRGDGSIYLAPMAANVAQIRTGVDKTAAELAVVRLQKEIEELNAQFTAVSATNYMAKIPTYPFTELLWIAPVVFLLVAVRFSATNQEIASFFFMGLAVACLVLLMVLYGKRKRAGDALQVQDLNALDAELDAKKAMLKRNQVIANS
jgi:hypothetical protein